MVYWTYPSYLSRISPVNYLEYLTTCNLLTNHLQPTCGPLIQVPQAGISSSKSSNGRKIARIARNSTIFGPNESSRRHLFLEKFSKEQNEQKVSEKIQKKIENFFKNFFVGFLLGNIKDASLHDKLHPPGAEAAAPVAAPAAALYPHIATVQTLTPNSQVTK